MSKRSLLERLYRVAPCALKMTSQKERLLQSVGEGGIPMFTNSISYYNVRLVSYRNESEAGYCGILNTWEGAKIAAQMILNYDESVTHVVIKMVKGNGWIEQSIGR